MGSSANRNPVSLNCTTGYLPPGPLLQVLRHGLYTSGIGSANDGSCIRATRLNTAVRETPVSEFPVHGTIRPPVAITEPLVNDLPVRAGPPPAVRCDRGM